MARRSHTKASRRPAIVAARVVALCAAVVAFLFAPLRTMSGAPMNDAPPAMKAVPDEDAPVLVEEHGAVVRVPALRPSGTKSRASAAAPALAPSAIALLSTVAASFTLEPPRGVTARVARARTHAELMVFLI
ncbi:MAG: hypothetical protein BGO98_07215 [Myxococcales bacterium 68-20]|nr:hypothetical protein [Myxococcales bacterium]OJY26787.1 MAG: hypothetical protein BGO98_07215 [Myxococcales bacterium 68-20]